VTGMTKGRNYGVTSLASVKEGVKKARAVRKAASRIHKLCNQALASKKDADLQATVTALMVAFAGV
jgi:hypothetical protein